MKILLCCLVLLNIAFCNAAVPQNPSSNQEVRDAILSLIHSNSLIDSKLERHETRTRALGELVKKGLMTLQKNQRIFEPIKGSFDRLDKRVSEIETMLLKSEKQKMDEQSKLANLLEKILAAFESSAQSAPRNSDDSDDDDDDEEKLPKKIDDLLDMVKGLRREIAEFRADQNSIEATNKNLVAQAEELVKDRTNQADAFAKKLEETLTKSNDGKDSKFETDVKASLNQITTEVKQLREKDLKASVSSSNGLNNDDRNFLRELSNGTIEAIQDMRLEVLTASDKSFAKTATRIQETHEIVDEMWKSVSEFITNTDAFFADSQKLSSDIPNSSKLEKIMLDTSNNVLETKRRFEYGIHQIILEVGDVMKTANTSMQKRLNELNDGILDNHNAALTNLSSKIETEMSQVWRQIGIMYQEITSSKKALDRLQEQTELYVNGTIMTMDSMEGKVGLITNRMQEVDSNLNYLLGRLSLVTQEFNQIKFGLGEALDNIRSSFMTVQEKVKQNMGPGPHRIEDSENEKDINSLSKRHAHSFSSHKPHNIA